MSPLYLKLITLGVSGVTVATVVPLSVIKGSESGNPIQVQRQLVSNSSLHSENLGRTDGRAGLESSHQQVAREENSGEQYGIARTGNPENLDSFDSSLPETGSVSAALSEVETRIDKCKDIANGSAGKLNMCYDESNDKKVKFTFFQFLEGTNSVNSYYSTENLSVTSSNNLKVIVKNMEDGGRKNGTVWLSLLDQVTSEGSLVLRTNSFNQSQCSVDWITDSSKGIRTNWRVICEAVNKK